MTWRKIRRQLKQIQVGKFIFNSGEVYQCTELTNKQLKILNMTGVERPSRFPDIKEKT